jgi:hypothetical protein
MTTLIIIKILLSISLTQTAEVLELETLSNGCGWYYVVPFDTVKVSVRNRLTPDNDGVYYINKTQYRNLRRVKIYNQAGVDIMDTVQFFSKVSHDILEDSVKNYRLMMFYYPTSNEMSRVNWKDPDVFYNYSKAEKIHRKKLIKSGKIRFE